MEGSGVCTACGASAELDADQKCPGCASGSMESQPEPEAEEPLAEATGDEAEGSEEAVA